MGMILNPKTGRYEKEKKKKNDRPTQIDSISSPAADSSDIISILGDPSYDIIIPDYPKSFVGTFPGSGQSQKIYATAQAFYSGIHFIIRNDIKSQAKAFLTGHFVNVIDKVLPPGTGIVFIFSDKRKITPTIKYDIDNRGYFWDKVFSDALEDAALIPEDNVFFLPTKIYHFDNVLKKDQIRILIYTP